MTGDESSSDQSLCAWPLPDRGDGPLEVIVGWPAQGIDEERIELEADAGRITEAAGQVVELWHERR